MKKIVVMLLFMCTLSTVTRAQNGNDQRTISTRIADLLAQMPAENAAKFQSNMEEISALGEKGLVDMIALLSPEGKGDNSNLEYAIGGFSAYVTKSGREQLRGMSVRAYCQALPKLNDKKNQAYIIAQLETVGKDDAVSCLQPYLSDERLCDPASRALASINSSTAGKVLLNALPNSQASCQVSIVEALGHSRNKEALQPVTALAGSNNENLNKAALYALAAIADPSSESVLAGAAEKSGYTFDDNNSVSAYLAYAENLLRDDKQSQADKIAKELLEKSRQHKQVHTRTAALELLAEIHKGESMSFLLEAAGDEQPEYRAAALKFAAGYITPANTDMWVKKLRRADPEVQAGIITMLGNTRAEAALPALLKTLKRTKNPQVKLAAIAAVGKTGQQQALDDLFKVMRKGSPEEIAAVKNAMLIMKGNTFTDQAAEAIPRMRNGTAKAALIDVLAARSASQQLNTVYPLLKDNDALVRKAAFSALPYLVSQENLPQLFNLLNENLQNEEISAVQDAIIAAVSDVSAQPQQTALVLEQMEKAPENKRPLFYKLLASIGGEKALKAVSAGFKSGNEETKKAARNDMTSWSDVNAADELYNISITTTNSAYLDQAIKGYVRLIAQASYLPEQRVLMLRKAMKAAKTAAQKRLILKEAEKNKTFSSLIFTGEFLDDPELQQAAANAVMDIALSGKEYYGNVVRDLLNKTIAVLKGPDSGYQKEAIRKHIAEMPKGEGFVSLFNGKDLTGWKGLVGNPIERAKMDKKTLAQKQQEADEVMRKGWKVENGELLFTGKGDNIATVKQYGDFEMLVDWKIYDDGNKDGDAGIYLRGTPQVQMWDTSRVASGAQVGSGGLYNNKVNPGKPLKVADNPLGEWNHFRIKMVGDRVTVHLNGELVTDNVILENYWDRSMPIFPIEQLELQAHGSRVAYRDIYVREIPRAEPFELSKEEKKEGFNVLFDGTNMHQWTGNTTDYVIENGTMVVRPKPGSRGNLYTREEYSDFNFRFDFMLTPGANNGLGIRAPLEGDVAYTGMELQILDNEADIYKNLKPYQYHGSLYGAIAAKRGYLKPVGEWNQQEVIIKGPKIKVILNGTVILDGDITEARKNGAIDGKEHPGLNRDTGHIGFLGHGSVVHFRNMRIKDLSKGK